MLSDPRNYGERMSFKGPSSIPEKEIVVCIVFVVGLFLIISGATSLSLAPEMRVWYLIGGALLLTLLLGGSAKLR